MNIIFTDSWLNAGLLYLTALVWLLTVDLCRRTWRRRKTR